ncbi:ROK family protein [Streptomyces sp. HSW2009]|uniref:ROK family protein n=1 Tax=Streptomyces sp. HSW2009 TaxID=3142890 RepID=UPI0032EBBC3C
MTAAAAPTSQRTAPAGAPTAAASSGATALADGCAELAVALDVGGTKIAGALVDRRGTLRARARRPTPPSTSPARSATRPAAPRTRTAPPRTGPVPSGAEREPALRTGHGAPHPATEPEPRTGPEPGREPAPGALRDAAPGPDAAGDENAAEAVMAAVIEVIAELAQAPEWTRVTRCGIGSAGPVDAEHGTVSPVNIAAWRDFPLHARTEAELVRHGAPVPAVLVGDGVAMTAAEHRFGAARGCRNALCLVVSTGVGGGLIVDDRLHPGPSGNAGHIGHISVAVDGAPCVCGSRGCVEAIASGTAIAGWAAGAGWRAPTEDRSAAQVAAAARAGDRVALAAFDRAGRALAAAIAGTATLLEVERAVIGGGVAAAGDVLFGPVRRHLATYAALSFVRGLTVVPAALGADAGLVGAAAAAFDLLSDGADHAP